MEVALDIYGEGMLERSAAMMLALICVEKSLTPPESWSTRAETYLSRNSLRAIALGPAIVIYFSAGSLSEQCQELLMRPKRLRGALFR